MPWSLHTRSNRMLQAVLGAQPSIQFTPDGVILEANATFLEFMGYRLEEIRGQPDPVKVTASNKVANIAAGGGPTQVRPASMTDCAKPAFSLKKP